MAQVAPGARGADVLTLAFASPYGSLYIHVQIHHMTVRRRRRWPWERCCPAQLELGWDQVEGLRHRQHQCDETNEALPPRPALPPCKQGLV